MIFSRKWKSSSSAGPRDPGPQRVVGVLDPDTLGGRQPVPGLRPARPERAVADRRADRAIRGPGGPVAAAAVFLALGAFALVVDLAGALLDADMRGGHLCRSRCLRRSP